MKTKQIVVDGVTYYASKPEAIDSPIKIVILQRGWVMVGRFEKKGDDCKLYDASVIRIWGTTKGLGEIAQNGPTSNTKLDKCFGVVEFDNLTKVATISCKEEVWQEKL
jgi:hypothetical protein